MLDRVDRIVVAAHDAETVAARWCDLVAAVIDRREPEPTLGSRKTVLRIGDAEMEIHEPVETGPVAEHLQHSGGPFAVGLAARDLDALLAHLERQKIVPQALAEGRWFCDSASLGIPGLRVVLSETEEHAPVGLLENLYECTHLTADAAASTAAIARVFGLDAGEFVAIGSDTYGYEGSLTLFDSQRLHRIETIHPYDRTKTMGRYFERFGPSLYMCYGEAADLAPIRERMKALAPDDWTGSDDDPDGMFIHPRATGSTMLGISRISHAWSWSGYPERIVPVGSSVSAKEMRDE
jgi:hypothetical protein